MCDSMSICNPACRSGHLAMRLLHQFVSPIQRREWVSGCYRICSWNTALIYQYKQSTKTSGCWCHVDVKWGGQNAVVALTTSITLVCQGRPRSTPCRTLCHDETRTTVVNLFLPRELHWTSRHQTPLRMNHIRVISLSQVLCTTTTSMT